MLTENVYIIAHREARSPTSFTGLFNSFFFIVQCRFSLPYILPVLFSPQY